MTSVHGVQSAPGRINVSDYL